MTAPHARSRAAGPPPAAPPHRVRVPVNLHRWDTIAFLHWPFAADDVARLLPPQLAVSTWDDTAWVSVTPFRMQVRLPGMPIVPPGWAFPETNVRTYVTGPGGAEGLWFLHMEVTARWFVAVLRSIGLPYVRRDMDVDVGAEHVTYSSRAPGRGSGGHRITVRPGEPLDPPAGGPWDRFVTARWAAYHRRGPLLLRTPVAHPAWPLRSAEVTDCRVDDLLRAARLPAPAGPPVAHLSAGVDVRVGVPRIAAVARGQRRGRPAHPEERR